MQNIGNLKRRQLGWALPPGAKFGREQRVARERWREKSMPVRTAGQQETMHSAGFTYGRAAAHVIYWYICNVGGKEMECGDTGKRALFSD